MFNVQLCVHCSLNNVDADFCAPHPSPIEWKLNSNNNSGKSKKIRKQVKSTKAILNSNQWIEHDWLVDVTILNAFSIDVQKRQTSRLVAFDFNSSRMHSYNA